MEIPQGFKQTIASVFYDKTIGVVSNTQEVEADGAVTTTDGVITNTFMGNVRMVNLKEVQQQFGLDYQIDVSITTSTNTVIDTNAIIEYDGNRFEVTDVLPTDSHITIVGKKWRSQV